MADNSALIAALQNILNTGVSQVVVDGQTVTYDVERARKRLRELMQTDNTNAGRRPVASIINLGGF